ncbi:hypothetical protein CCICO_07995 [Corynebacterium ciconiae DSM 44920]|uniref:DUF4282 domain-containing protein n=1 Tax=Corynebacterium ciconiae TaxID=227319 RepID=UPI00036D15DB|nr:DUF4282 domain-containing protein [Corynebacterium ciconiae]WKD61615.1 hypothetical protein CCICO_07995 [Corynebacterium ciconiae DSM 44920]
MDNQYPTSDDNSTNNSTNDNAGAAGAHSAHNTNSSHGANDSTSSNTNGNTSFGASAQHGADNAGAHTDQNNAPFGGQQYGAQQTGAQYSQPQNPQQGAAPFYPSAENYQNSQGQGAGLGGTGLPQFSGVGAESKNFVQALFDLSFSSFITIKFAKAIHLVNMILALLGYAFWVFIWTVMADDSVLGMAASFFSIITLLFGWIPALVQIVVVRLALEMNIALVRTAQNTSALREATIGY